MSEKTIKIPVVSDDVKARIIVPIVLSPDRYSQVMLKQELGISLGSLNRAVESLRNKAWIRVSSLTQTAGRPHGMLAPTPAFNLDFSQIAENAKAKLDARGQGLLAQALSACAEAQSLPEGSEQDDFRAAFLGRAVLLGEVYDLSADGWFSGAAGWSSFISIEAAASSAV